MPYLHSKAISANDVNLNFKSLKRGNIGSVVFKSWHKKNLSINKALFFGRGNTAVESVLLIS